MDGKTTTVSHAPQQQQQQPMRHFDVAIIGYGPVGATLAGLLGRAGVSVGVFERSQAVYEQPRAVGFDQDAMRIFQRIGVADALAPHVERFRDTEYLGVDGLPIQRVRPAPPPHALTWAPSYTCDQPGLEAALRRAVQSLGSVDVALGSTLESLRQESQRVLLEVRDAQGRAQRHSASWVVGCDGASSTVRRQAGITLESMDYDEPWIVVDAFVDAAHLDRLPSTNVQYCDPLRPSTYVVCPGRHRRWEFMLLENEPRDVALAPQQLWTLLAPWLAPGQGVIRRAATYRFHALVARQWRAGRVFLAGDSAHQTPPFLGQGMCQGIRDAGNLAWKLCAVLRGEAGDALLDSYAEERIPHVEATTRLARDFGHLMSERDPARARARDLRMRSLQPGGPRTLLRQDLIPGLEAGFLAAGAACAGTVFPQPRVAGATAHPDGRLMDDCLGPRFRLVVTDRLDGADRQAVCRLAAACGMPVQWLRSAAAPAGTEPSLEGAVQVLRETENLLAHWFEVAGVRGALVRPDHYVFGAFATVDEARRLFAALRTHWHAAVADPPERIAAAGVL